MKHSLTKTFFAFATMFLTLAFSVSAASDKPAKKANCELRLVTNAGAGEIFMSIFTRSKEECLSKSDSAVEAKFHTLEGNVAQRGGAGPQQ